MDEYSFIPRYIGVMATQSYSCWLPLGSELMKTVCKITFILTNLLQK